MQSTFEQTVARNKEGVPYEILLVDDHKIFREGIKALVERHQEFKVIGEAESGAEAVSFCRNTRPALVLMDIGLPGLNGIEATLEIARHCPECKIVILSMYDDESSVLGAIRAGARAFVLKKAGSADLMDALRTVANGGFYLSGDVAGRVQRRIQRGDLASDVMPPVLARLSPRELQLLRLIAEGKTSQEIAIALGLGLQTVRSYRKTMMKKIRVSNIAGLTQTAISAGLTRSLSLPELNSTSAPELSADLLVPEGKPNYR